jgi:uncharacterized membrane protein
MLVLLVLLGLFAILHVPPVASLKPFATRRDKAAWAMAGMFLFTGIDHLVNPQRYFVMMPPFLPWPVALIYISGVAELVGAAGLTVRRARRYAAFGLALLLVSVFPANIYVAISAKTVEGLPAGSWYYWLRLPLQFVFFAWALWCARSNEPLPKGNNP